ncbi:MAG: hypothetical protein ACPL28_09430 [bacterium]
MIVKYVMIIILIIVLIIFVIQFILFLSVRNKDQYITIKEVIPDAPIVSEFEGIIEHEGKKFILGQADYKRKKDVIKYLHLDELKDFTEIDLRFKKQVIVRKNEFEKN